MGKKVLSVFASVALIVGLMPSLAWAEELQQDSDSLVQDQPVIPIDENGTCLPFDEAKALLADNDVSEGESDGAFADDELNTWNAINTCEWMLDDQGCLTIRPADGAETGVLSIAEMGPFDWPWFTYSYNITSVVIEQGVDAGVSCNGLFFYFTNLESIDLTNLNTSNATGMEYLFFGCSALKSVNLSSLDTSNVDNLYAMFYECSKLETLDLSSFDISSEVNTYGMFGGCSLLDNITLKAGASFSETSLRDCCWENENGDRFLGADAMFVANAALSASCGAVIYHEVKGKDGYSVINTCEWNIDDQGCLIIRPGEGAETGVLSSPEMNMYSWPWMGLADDIKSVVVEEGVDAGVITSGMFYGCSNIETMDLSHLGTSNVTDMSAMFNYCESLTELDLSTFDTSSVIDISDMFYSCESLTKLDISTFKTANVKNMSGMFCNCASLKKIDLSSFDTSYVTDMGFMFSGCTGLETIDLSHFKTSNVADMTYMFLDCSSIETIDLTSFDTSNIEDLTCMFSGCTSLKSVDVSSFDTSKVLSMYAMFLYCKNLESLNLSSFDTSNVTNMASLFAQCTALRSITLKAGASYADVSMRDCVWENDKGESFPNTEALFAANAALDPSSAPVSYHEVKTEEGYSVCNTCEWKLDENGCLIIRPAKGAQTGVLTVSAIDEYSWPWSGFGDKVFSVVIEEGVDAGVTCNGMFSEFEHLTTINLENLNTSDVTDMYCMFYGCSALEYVDLSFLKTSNVKSMARMFQGCESLKSINLSPLDTGNLEKMYAMFCDCSSLKVLDLSSFNTSRVTDMDYLFASCPELKTIYVSGDLWTVGEDCDTYNMFESCDKLKGQCGTTYSYDYFDGGYARIDSQEAPGYLSEKPSTYPFYPATTYRFACAADINLILDAAGVYPIQGSNVSVWANNLGENQQFTAELTEDGYFVFRSAANADLVLDAAGIEPIDGANVSVWIDNGGLNQKWSLVSAFGGYKIVSAANPSLVLTASGADLQQGANVVVAADTNETNQVWCFCSPQVITYADITATGMVKNIMYGMFAEPSVSVSVGGQVLTRGTDYVILYDGSESTPDEAGEYQVSVEGIGDYEGRVNVGTLTLYDLPVEVGVNYCCKSAADASLVLDAAAINPQSGANVSVWANNDGDNQLFTVEVTEDWYVVIRSVANADLVLDASGVSPQVGSNVSMWSFNGGLNQQWVIAPGANGGYVFVCAANPNLVLDAAGVAPAIGSNVSVWTANDGLNQSWMLEARNSSPE